MVQLIFEALAAPSGSYYEAGAAAVCSSQDNAAHGGNSVSRLLGRERLWLDEEE